MRKNRKQKRVAVKLLIGRATISYDSGAMCLVVSDGRLASKKRLGFNRFSYDYSHWEHRIWLMARTFFLAVILTCHWNPEKRGFSNETGVVCEIPNQFEDPSGFNQQTLMRRWD